MATFDCFIRRFLLVWSSFPTFRGSSATPATVMARYDHNNTKWLDLSPVRRRSALKIKMINWKFECGLDYIYYTCRSSLSHLMAGEGVARGVGAGRAAATSNQRGLYVFESSVFEIPSPSPPPSSRDPTADVRFMSQFGGCKNGDMGHTAVLS